MKALRSFCLCVRIVVSHPIINRFADLGVLPHGLKRAYGYFNLAIFFKRQRTKQINASLDLVFAHSDGHHGPLKVCDMAMITKITNSTSAQKPIASLTPLAVLAYGWGDIDADQLEQLTNLLGVLCMQVQLAAASIGEARLVRQRPSPRLRQVELDRPLNGGRQRSGY